MPLKTLTIPKGTKVYYASAKFRELQLDKMLNNELVPDFPVQHNFFVGGRSDILGYTNTIDHVVEYYTDNINPEYVSRAESYLSKNFNVTHTYRTKKKLHLINLMDRQSIGYLLFDDPESPFHISKMNKPVVDNDGAYRHLINNKHAKNFFRGLELNLNDVNHRYGGFLLLVSATGYYLKKMRRHSAICFDYTMIEMLRQYVIRSNLNIDGWYQPPDSDFHEEYAFFNPKHCLVTDYQDPLSWMTHVNIPENMGLKHKIKFQLDLIRKWRESAIDREQKEIVVIKETIQDVERNGADSVYYIEHTEEYEETVREYLDKLNAQLRDSLAKIDAIKTQPPDVSSLYSVFKPEGRAISHSDRRLKYHLQKYYNKAATSCKYEACSKPVSFESNECQTTLKNLAEEMRRYPNANNIHHAGSTVADHSIWVARALHKWLGYVDHPWTEGIDESLRNIALISAFLHDIGKIGDLDTKSLPKNNVKPDHPYRGYLYMLNKLDFKTMKAISEADPRRAMTNCYVNSEFHVATVATVVALHHHFGELLMSVDMFLTKHIGYSNTHNKLPYIAKMTMQRYMTHSLLQGNNLLADTLSTMIEFKYILFYFDFLDYYANAGGNINNREETMQTLLVLLAVCAADVYGAHQVPNDTENNSIYNASLSQLLDPQILNLYTRKHNDFPEIFRGYYRFLYYTLGLKERKRLIAFAKSVGNPSRFLKAWKQLNEFLDYLNGEPGVDIPDIYAMLDMSSVDSFLTSMLRLLKSGELSRRVLADVPSQIKDVLLETSDDSMHPEAEKYLTHRNKGLAADTEMGIVPVKSQYGKWKQAPN